MNAIKKAYLPIKNTTADVNCIEISIAYNLGGHNCFTGDNEARGYYAFVTPVKKERGLITIGAFTGIKHCIVPVSRRSKKKEAEAVAAAPEELEYLIKYLAKNKPQSQCGELLEHDDLIGEIKTALGV